MTWSIVVHDPASGAFAVAVTTCSFAVGASCPHLRAGVGAVSTQSFTNRYLGPAVLDGMARGLSPAMAIEGALAGDEGRHLRQVHAVDRFGRSAAFTGRNCVEWAGERTAQNLSVAGNMLSGPEVLHDTFAAFTVKGDSPLPERLVAALEAGEAAGGDRRGRQSAALRLVTTEDFPDLDIRVDDHPEPLKELARLLAIWRRDRAPYLDRQPRKANPSGEIDMEATEAAWKAAGLDLRFGR
ncbi:Uncharacterized conserved protein, Ntn-hydrolase superfamily [Roseomonas rosea]|uniref:Uncharacterized conserved protein, Ntn-hydrolase superfamily n=1 Tax=Muricoccus roseus TaxID=198092 RepID=A0A1M6E4R6_9PROT|nr:DUF1028 domain-containing protein [Roseomonas rosea]SHI80497.1 Uncharacterized conserved protein, Ntn-hydrolase superfamily [Roseomonas rosea]